MSMLQFRQIKGNYYIKKDTRKLKRIIRILGLCLSFTGVCFAVYFFFPIISWKFYLEPAFASQAFVTPIPKTTVITKDSIESLWKNTALSLQQIYDEKAQNWLPAPQYKEIQISTQPAFYAIAIPKLNIKKAAVSTIDTDISTHLINFPGTPAPPSKGNAVIFGHSSLPSLFDPKNYKTIFSTVHTLIIGDEILASVNNMTYKYKIYNISIKDPSDTSYLSQDTHDSYLTIVTCTPPGTIWKRLIISAKLEKI